MFYCERCGTRFNAGAASTSLVCFRCRRRDGVISPLVFRIFEPEATEQTASDAEVEDETQPMR